MEDCDNNIKPTAIPSKVIQLQDKECKAIEKKFKEEWCKIVKATKKSCLPTKEAEKPENCKKNYCPVTLPFDCNRVSLKPNCPNDGCYINASRIKGADPCTKTYIATQYTLSKETQSDFWRMICQQKVKFIIMLADDKPLTPCEIYWPEPKSKRKYGSYKVENEKEVTRDGLILRKLNVTDPKDSGCPIKIDHIQLTKWPQGCSSECPHGILLCLQVVNTLRRDLKDTESPIVVQSKVGAGRAGMVIAIDWVMDVINKQGIDCQINVREIVTDLRKQRTGTVQNKDQYMFVYWAVSHFILQIQYSQRMKDEYACPPKCGLDYSTLYKFT